jgi:hypothetical protein
MRRSRLGRASDKSHHLPHTTTGNIPSMFRSTRRIRVTADKRHNVGEVLIESPHRAVGHA